ncbi:MAG TPA: hypothetical protein PK733_19180 [Clostridiales bacterium]|mgnify:CR=1 FL=1|nr:hypothetical protein [Clostridiales bacterium]
MNNILLVAAGQRNEGRAGVLQSRISYLLDKKFYKKRITEYINKSLMDIESSSNGNIFLTELPYYVLEPDFYSWKGKDRAADIKNSILEKIGSLCFEKETDRCYFSNKLFAIPGFEIQVLQETYKFQTAQVKQTSHNRSKKEIMYPGKVLFRALTLDILKKICNDLKIDIRQSDVVIIGDVEDKEEVLKTIRKLSLVIKYLTVLLYDEDVIWLKNELEDIYAATGLAVNLACNLGGGAYNALRNADIILNYGCVESCVQNLVTCSKLKAETVIVNNSFTHLNISFKKPGLKNPLIEGIVTNISKAIPDKFRELIPEQFTSAVAAEILTGFRTGWVQEEMAKRFKSDGYYIKGFTGFNTIDIKPAS